jgi:hypothetical protein
MVRPRLYVLALSIVLLLPASAARASAYSNVLHTYEQNGSVPPCQFSSSQLSSALKGVDTYGAQYFADFTNAIQSALAARAAGQCGASGAQPTKIPPATHLPSPAPHSVKASTESDLPAPILLIAVLGGAALLTGVAVGIATLRGWEPRRLAASRHSFAEAGYRLSGSWAEFRDWLRSA